MKKTFTLITLISLLFSGVAVAQTVEFSDDFESGTASWNLEGSWALTTSQSNGGSNSLTDSPGGFYLSNTDISATIANSFDFSSVLDATLTFDAIYDIEGGDFDFAFVEASNDGGSTWFEVARFLGDGNLSPWINYEFSLGALVGSNNAQVRFRFFSDGGLEFDGIYIDNVEVTSSNVDNSAPFITHNPPLHYEGSENDMTLTAELIDVSGIGSTTINYMVDGGAEQSVTGTNTSGNNYEFVIPTQEAGAQVDYWVSATDDSANSNSITSDVFSYIAGRHVFVDNGVVNFINSFGPDGASGAAGCAVKYNLNDRRIVYALIRNYTDVQRPNDDIQVHVWGVDDLGLPGEDLIPPLTLAPEANSDQNSLMTRVDLRPFQSLWNIDGDVFIGFTVPSGEVWLVQSTPGIGSSSFVLDPGGWVANTNDDYHFRLVTDESLMTNVEELIFDQSIDLYPNPTSGNAQLQLGLERTSDLTIKISNQLGQVIDHFTEKNVGFGNIDLNTSQLSPGIYYISISNGEVVSTKKLVKQ